MQVSKPRRHRATPSDPFNDPSSLHAHSPSYSSYGVPTLSRNAPPQHSAHRPPPPPPKVPLKQSTARRQLQPSAMNRDQVIEAVRDTVQVRGSESNPRTRMNRSNTEVVTAHPTLKPIAPTSRRSHSQDSGMQTPDKNKSTGRARPGKKGSSHADVIDRLDFSGVGPMFHHDGPFDACAPSRNRHRTKAPMMAWSAVTDADKEALANAQEMPRAYESPYPTSPDVYVPYEAPKKKYDAIAEAWGIHEPEPFEDFSAGGGSSRIGSEAYPSRNGTSRRPAERAQRDKQRERTKDVRPSANRQQSKRGVLPPPQPIFVPEADGELPAQAQGEPPSPTTDAPKRSKSIIRRIRKMRDSPNIPLGADDEGAGRDPSPTSSAENTAMTTHSAPAYATRPTHRAQNSLLGRFGRAANRDLSPGRDDGGYVYVEDPPPMNKEKSLPATPGRGGYSPPAENVPDYFEHAGGDAAVSPGGSNLGRKTSLMKKVRGVVKAAKA